MPRLQVLEPDAGGCSGHALTGEERGYERAVIGVGADGSGRQVGRLQMQSPRRQEYGKLSCVGRRTCLRHKDRLDAVSALWMT